MLLYFKKLREDGGGAFEEIKVDSEQFTLEGLLNDLYVGKGWAVSSEEAYQDQLKDAEGEEEVVEDVSEGEVV